MIPNIEKVIDELISKLEMFEDILINRKFYRYAIIQSKEFTDVATASNNESAFEYKGKMFYVVDDGADVPCIWVASAVMYKR